MDIENGDLILLEGSVITFILSDINAKLPKVQKKKLTRDEIARKANLNVPCEFKQCYVDILYKHQAAISANKCNLRLSQNYKHKIHLKNNDPVY